MHTFLRAYHPITDFTRVRDFLQVTLRASTHPLNWRMERWNYARYFVAPMLGNYGRMVPAEEKSWEAIWFLERNTRIAENARGDIVGVSTVEDPRYGGAWLFRHPDYDSVLEPLLDHCEATLLHPNENCLTTHIYDHDDYFQTLVQRRGYQRSDDRTERESVYTITATGRPGVELPAGYQLRSMADGGDIEARREILGRSFNHTNRAEWPCAFAYRQLQQAPDYRPELDLYVVAPDGSYAACGIIWFDSLNRIAVMEPLGTHPDHRRLGLARAVVAEGIGRAAARGATHLWVGSDQPFYQSVGFEVRYTIRNWTWKL